MTKSWKTSQILMVFLLLACVLPFHQLMGQEGERQFEPPENNYEDELLMNLETRNEAYNFSKDERTQIIPESNYTKSPFSATRKQNEVNLMMEGVNNNAEVTQQIGTSNYLNLKIEGKNNQATYQQEGNNNYIFDRIRGNNIYREINQSGNQLGIYNTGMQDIPMIINQWGAEMQILIDHSP